MSVKIMGLVWDLDLPRDEKFVLLAYADHADHNGKNIFPAINTIAQKTGYSERSIQSITRKLEERGLLVTDGIGPKGTNKWRYGGEIFAPAEISGVQNDAEGVQKTTERGAVATAPEPSLTIKEPSSSEAEVFRAFEANIGVLTPFIGDALGDLTDEHAPEWVIAAIKEAAIQGVRNLKYITAILNRWKVEGYGTPFKKNGNGKKPAPAKPKETPEQRAERVRIAKEMVQ